MANPFDYDEDDVQKAFEKNTIFGFGVSPHDSDFGTAHDFMKKSLAAANMLSDDYDDGLSNITSDTQSRSVAFSKHTAEPDGLKPLKGEIKKKNPSNFNSSAKRPSSTTHMEDDWKSHAQSAYEKNLDEVVNNTPQIYASDYQKLQEELRKSKQVIEMMKGEKWTNIPVKDTIKRIVTGKPYALEGYKSLSQKKELLDEAVKSRDGNTIITVIIFLQKTLNSKLFHREIQRCKAAVKHYITYLRKQEEWETLEDLYKRMVLLEEAAYLRYERINLEKNVNKRIEQLRKWIQDYGLKQEVSEILPFVNDEMCLLEKQKQMEDEDKIKAATQSDVISKYHARPCIENKSLITTVSYCALFHYDKGSKYHPENMKKTFKLSDKQFEWAVIPPRANLHRWTDIQELLTSSGWFKKGEVSSMGFDQVVGILHKAKANEEIITKYLNLISNLELRFKTAKNFAVHDVAIETLVQIRDRQRMEQYRQHIGDSSKYRQKINDLLYNTGIKWR